VDQAVSAADEYTGMIFMLALALLLPLRLMLPREAHRRAAWRLATVVERLLMIAFLALVLGLVVHSLTGFDALRWLGRG
jgi:bacteriorhodopsin